MVVEKVTMGRNMLVPGLLYVRNQPSYRSFYVNAKIAACLLLASIICSATFRATVAEEPRISAYVHLDQCIDADFPEPQRERQIEQMIASMHETGVEAVVPYVSTTSGVAHYPSEFLPERRWGDWNPVKTLISAARRHGLQVYLCVPVLACGHDKPAGILQQHPEWALRDTSGQPIGSISPGHPEARRWVVDWLGELVDRYRPDGILLDYMRYASQETQVDKVSTEKLSVVIARQRDADKADVTQSFREQLLTELMEMVSTELRQRQPDLRIAIYSWGYHVTDNHRVAQAWPIWAERGYIDEVNVSGYWYPDSFSRRFGATYTEAFQNALAGARRLLKESKSDARLTFALGVRTSHGQVESVDDIARYLVLAKALDVDGTVIFTWSYLQPFLPELVQAGVLQNFASPRVSQDPTAATLLVATAD